MSQELVYISFVNISTVVETHLKLADNSLNRRRPGKAVIAVFIITQLLEIKKDEDSF